MGLAVVNGLLYAVGGFDGTSYLKTIEVYDPEQNQWRLCGSMNYRRLGGGVGVVRLPHHEAHYWWHILERFIYLFKNFVYCGVGFKRVKFHKKLSFSNQDPFIYVPKTLV